ncbi:MAG TPA: type I 3-dehydroquinate dehydratase [Candidatus Acidoferrales bacterium]|nr:type I 3-dehydroquinate dehydratase [Candidatus Acidoferrales bacterium]
MQINYCLPIIKKSKQEVLDVIEKNRNEYQYLEIWLDPIKDLDTQFIDRLTYMLQDKLIVLFSRGNKIKTQMTHEKKSEIIAVMDGSDSYLDLDIAESEELAYLKRKSLKVKTIISYHNYKETPVDLEDIIKQMDKHNPDIYKIATMCNNETDALKLLLLQQNLKLQNKRHIVLGMGEFGTITRVFGTLWGNELIYAPETKQESSAPGQLTKEELETILKILNLKS